MTNKTTSSAYKPVAWRLVGGLVVLGVFAVVLALLIRPGERTVVNQSGLSVVAAENFWGNIAQQIGGDHVHVTSIISDPTTDPHLYESDARDAAAVASADIVIVNGLGYDDFMNKLVGALSSNNRQVLTAAHILQVRGNDANPHLWYDIPQVHLIAQQMAMTFEAKDPAHKADYQDNLALFNGSLQPLINTINEIKMQYSGMSVAYTERVSGYVLADAGLGVKTPSGFASAVEDGTDPSPADTQAMDELMTGRKVKVLAYNAQATSPVTQHVRDLAQQAGVPIIGVTETLPTNEKTYQSWQKDQLNELLKALQQ